MGDRNILLLLIVIACDFSASEGINGQKRSLAFVFDATGSMANDLEELKKGATSILHAMNSRENSPIENYILVPFRDPAVGPITITKDDEVFRKSIEDIDIYGGQDCPEYSVSAIKAALNASLENSHIYVFSDASAKDYAFAEDVYSLIQRKHSQVVFVLTGDCSDVHEESYQVYEKIAAASSGQVFRLNKNEVFKVLKYVEDTLDSNRVNLAMALQPKGTNQNQKISVDATLEEVTVSVAGGNAKLEIKNPLGEVVDGPPKISKILDLSKIQIVNIINPEPGNWSVRISSDEDHSVKVTGISKINFKYGFSINETNRLYETSNRPLHGTHNYLLIALKDSTNKIESINSVDILDVSGKHLFEIPLIKIETPDESQAYKTKSFPPPGDFFNIAINGIDLHGNSFKRIGATAIHSQSPEKPFISVTDEIRVNIYRPLTISCKIESLVPVSVWWFKENTIVQEKQEFLQSTVSNFSILDTDVMTGGVYTCKASNEAGVSKKQIRVEVIGNPPFVELIPKSIVLPKHSYKNVSFECIVKSESQVDSVDIFFENESKEIINVSDFNKINTEPSVYIFNSNATESGMYRCEAINEFGKTVAQSQIKIIDNIQIDLHPFVKYESGEDVNILCSISNSKNAEWTLPHGATENNKRVVKTFNDGVLEVILSIKNALITDSGIYECSAFYDDELYEYNPVTKTVEISFFERPSIEMNDANVLAEIGERITLKCEARGTPEPSIMWIVKNRQSDLEKRMLDSPQLTIQNITLDDQGTYVCHAKNEHGESAKEIDVRVWEKLRIGDDSKNLTAQIDGAVEIACNINGVPAPDIKWFHKDTELANHKTAIDSNNLNLRELKWEDRGTYTCVAANEFESVQNDIFLDVIGDLPSVQMKTLNSSYIFGTKISIECTAESKLPIESILMYFHTVDFTKEELNIDSILKKNGMVYYTYSFSLNERTEGFYVCEAVNYAGSTKKTTYVKILPPLEVNVSPKLIEYEDNENVTLKCDIFGSVHGSWNISNIDHFQYDLHNEIDVNNNSRSITINIYNASSVNEGEYTCAGFREVEAVKEFSNSSAYAKFVAKPKFVMTPSNLSAEVGSDLILDCNVAAIPEPDITWTLPNQVVSNSKMLERKLEIKSVNIFNVGAYTCRAENRLGVVEGKINVFVWVMPFVKEHKKNISVPIYGETTIDCNINGLPRPAISWFRNDVRIGADKIANDDQLYLTDVNVEDGGSYSCFGENIYGNVSNEIHVEIVGLEPPKISSNNMTSDIILPSGQNEFNLPCRATGKPAPTIRWLRNGKVIDYENDNDLVVANGTLIFKHLNESHHGIYTCEAVNVEGYEKSEYNISVIIPPSMKNKYEEKVDALEGSNVTIYCPLQFSKILPQIKWFKNLNVEMNNEDSLALDFINVTRNDAANYSCVASNIMGNATSSIELYINWPPALLTPNEETFDALLGEALLLKCSIDANPECKYLWTKDNATMFESTNSLFLKSVQLNHEGEYVCVASNSFGEVYKRFTVIVSDPPKIQDASTKYIEILEGQTFTLECFSNGVPEPHITWNVIHAPDWTEQADGSLLKTENISTSSDGVHSCEARNRRGFAIKEYHISVLRVPNVTIMLKNDETASGIYYLKEYTEYTFLCSSTGKPIPSVIWQKNGNILNESNHDAVLHFSNMTTKDSGTYACMATNKVGSEVEDIVINVLTSPRIHAHSLYRMKNENSILTPIEHQFLSLNCFVSGNPSPDVYWLKDGKHIGYFDSNMQLENHGQVLLIRRIRKYHSGNYMCVAKNSMGEDRHTFNVDVLYPPHINFNEINFNQHLTARIGENVEFHCLKTGNPKSEIKWLKSPNLEITGHNFFNMELKRDSEILRINNVTLENNGRYVCISSNSAGMVELEYSLDVIERPRIDFELHKMYNTPEILVVKIKRSFRLHCSVLGRPEPKITWVKDGNLLKSDNETLFVSMDRQILNKLDAKLYDSGKYTCVAENTGGKVENHFNVKIVVPGQWSSWSSWTSCNVSCGMGRKNRTRSCTYFGGLNLDSDLGRELNASLPLYDVLDRSSCPGSDVEYTACFDIPCTIDGGWSEWGDWSKCSLKCGLGVQRRQRSCSNPEPKYGGAPCLGDDFEEKFCEGSDCSLWLPWSKWSPCSVTCGRGLMKRFRKCDGPDDTCFGDSSEVAECALNDCNDNAWSAWSDWGGCSASCGFGYRKRTRRCEKGYHCKGSDMQIERCSEISACNPNSVNENSNRARTFSRNTDGVLNGEKPYSHKEQTGKSPYMAFNNLKKKNIGNTFVSDANEYEESPYYSSEIDNNDDLCTEGFYYNAEAVACYDINECDNEFNECHSTQLCKNTLGTFQCLCDNGYMSMGIGKRCLDINECNQEKHQCSHECFNIPGSYLCRCPTTHTLSSDLKTCIEADHFRSNRIAAKIMVGT